MPRKKHTEIEKNIMIDVSKNLKNILSRKGMTQRELAERAQLSQSSISDILIGNVLISPGNLEKISKALNVEKSLIDSSMASNLSNILDIENLINYDFVYKGIVLNEEQKKIMLKLLVSMIDFPK